MLTRSVLAATVELVGFLHGKRTSTGRAQVLKARGLEMSSGTGFEWQNPIRTVASHIRVRVIPDDGGPEFESAAGVWGGDESHLVEGHWTYVLYDPAHSGQCDVDGDRLMKEFGPVDGKKRRTSIPQWWAREKLEGVVQDPDKIVVVSNPGSQQPAGAARGPEDVVSGLKDLAQLHATGALSDAEFAAAKARLLAAAAPPPTT